jgi:hypothetical protein
MHTVHCEFILEALASTPLDGLPERAGQKKTTTQGKTKAKASKVKAVTKKAKEA